MMKRSFGYLFFEKKLIRLLNNSNISLGVILRDKKDLIKYASTVITDKNKSIDVFVIRSISFINSRNNKIKEFEKSNWDVFLKFTNEIIDESSGKMSFFKKKKVRLFLVYYENDVFYIYTNYFVNKFYYSISCSYVESEFQKKISNWGNIN